MITIVETEVEARPGTELEAILQRRLDDNPEDHGTRLLLAEHLASIGDDRAPGYFLLARWRRTPYSHGSVNANHYYLFYVPGVYGWCNQHVVTDSFCMDMTHLGFTASSRRTCENVFARRLAAMSWDRRWRFVEEGDRLAAEVLDQDLILVRSLNHG